MKLQEWKEQYPDAQSYYQGFLKTEEYKALVADFDTLKNEIQDEDDYIDNCLDIFLDSLENWVLDEIDEADFVKAEEWFNSMLDALAEEAYNGLT